MGAFAGRSLKNDLIEDSAENLLRQLSGTEPQKKYSGELTPGRFLEIEEVLSGKEAETQQLRAKLELEKKLREEEKRRIEEKGEELKLRLHALIQEVYQLAKTTQGLGQEVKTASFEAPVNPGVYHLIFFEKLLEFIRSFRKKIEEASIWLRATNKRAEKKNFWGVYKKHGSKFLLAPDHYLQRSAG